MDFHCNSLSPSSLHISVLSSYLERLTHTCTCYPANALSYSHLILELVHIEPPDIPPFAFYPPWDFPFKRRITKNTNNPIPRDMNGDQNLIRFMMPTFFPDFPKPLPEEPFMTVPTLKFLARPSGLHVEVVRACITAIRVTNKVGFPQNSANSSADLIYSDEER